MNKKGLIVVLLLLFSLALIAEQKPAPNAQAQLSVESTPSHADSGTLSLDTAVREALEKNPAVQSALHMVNAQRSRVPQAKALPDPTISGGWAGNITPFSVQDGDPSSNRNVGISEKFPYPGKLKLRGEMASKEVDAAQTDLEAARRRVTADVKTAYYDYFYFDKAIQITEKNKDLLDKLSKISEARYRVGKAMQQDVLRSQVEISLLMQKLAILEEQRAAAQVRLNTLLDRDPEAPLPPAADVQPSALNYSLDELYAMAVKNDTGVQRDSQMVERNQLAVSLAEEEYRPDIGVGYMYMQRPDMPDMHAVTFSVNVPVFYKTKQREGVAQASEELASEEKNRDNRMNELKFELKQQYLAAKTAEQLLHLYSKAVVPQSSLALESSMSAYQVGNVDFLSMLTNFTTLLNYETDYYRQVADYQMALARMEPLVGVELTTAQTLDQQGAKEVQK